MPRRRHHLWAGARRAPSVPGRPRDGPASAEAKPRRGVGRRREPAHVRAHAAGAVPAPVRRGAVGRAEARRNHKPTADEPASASRSNARSAARLHPCSALSAASPVERRRSSARNKPARSSAVAPEPDPQDRRRDVGGAFVLARARTTWRPPLPQPARTAAAWRTRCSPSSSSCTARDKDAGVRAAASRARKKDKALAAALLHVNRARQVTAPPPCSSVADSDSCPEVLKRLGCQPSLKHAGDRPSGPGQPNARPRPRLDHQS
jgi:hypothetical protein